MAALAKLSIEDIAGYCAGESLSDASMEEQLRQLEEQECSELDFYASYSSYPVAIMHITNGDKLLL